jgi:heptosyltransferase-2
MIAYFLLIIAEQIISLLPRNAALSFGRFLGGLWYLLDAERRHMAKRNLSMAFFGEKSYSEICRLTRESFRHIGMVFADSLRMKKIIASANSDFVQIEGIENVERAFSDGKGLLFSLPHFGNWEILVLLGNRFSRPLYDVARQIDNPYIERHISHMRKRAGMRFIDKNDAARKILSCLRDNCGVGVFMDQNAGREGIYAEFFRRKASTYPTVAAFAPRTGSAVMIIYSVMQPDRKYKIVIEGPVETLKTDNPKQDIAWNTALIVKRFESIIRRHPEQYFWVHQRWKPIQNKLMRREFRRVESIVVKAPNWMGDVIMALPAIGYIRRVFPEARIKVLVKESLADLLRHSREIDEVMTYRLRKGLMRLGDELGIVRRIRKEYFNLAVVFPFSISSVLWMRLAGIPIRLGANVRKRGAFLTHPISAQKKSEHQRDYFLRISRRLGTRDIQLDPVVSIGKAESGKADGILQKLKVENVIRVGIHPGAAYGSAKRWLPERFGELAAYLAKEGIAVFVFGSKDEKSLADEVVKKSNSKAINLCGQLSLGELAAMLKRCDVAVTNDSGPMHLAGAVGAKVVAIFGSTNPEATSSSGNCDIIWKNVDCSPCFRRECRLDFKCMKSITTDEVYAAVKRILDRSNRE